MLDAVKRQLILDLATEGLSRRAIARIVGCAPSTITRTARRDPGFGVELALAEETLARNALQTLGWAVQQGKYWRASRPRRRQKRLSFPPLARRKSPPCNTPLNKVVIPGPPLASQVLCGKQLPLSSIVR